MTPYLALEKVACRRGGRRLFEGIDLDLGPGDAALVIGPNGVGKSSLLRLIAGLLPSEAGTVRREGAVALADEHLALDRDRTLLRALTFWARLDGADDAAVVDALDAMGLVALAGIPVRLLSTGQRRRAGIARVIAGAAPIWLLDEPGNGLDDDARARLVIAMAAHRAQGGIVVAASHQPLGLDDAVTLSLGAAA